MISCRAVAILETMWGGSGCASGMFCINPSNFTGRRLYWFLGHKDLWCTNACREYVATAKQHGKPDPVWLAGNLQRLSYGLLLICGKVAQRTYDACRYRPDCRILEIPHPAARTWTKKQLNQYRRIIQSGVH